MQDRFKFRTYIPDLKFFKYWGWIEENHYIGLCPSGDYSMAELLEKYTDQCTGLKDKNGELIYEGDILKGEKDMICSPHSSKMVDKVGIVEIPQNMFVASCQDVKNNCTLFCQNDWVKTEVIGNIYENKELLNA
jgi:uncharacterized phage protein (TIGR01671 family)